MSEHALDENAPSRDVAIYAPPEEKLGLWSWRRLGGALSLSLVVLIGAGAVAAHVHALRATDESAALDQKLDAISKRLEALEANRAHDEIAGLRKSMAEVKGSERDVNARLDKLAERMDHTAPATKLGELVARLDKLETKTVAVAPAKPSPPLKSSAGVSNETTGAISKAQGRLRGFWISEVHNGFAVIEGPEGEFETAPGDIVPGAGRVLRIERAGRDWVVVTTEGRIETARD